MLGKLHKWEGFRALKDDDSYRNRYISKPPSGPNNKGRLWTGAPRSPQRTWDENARA
jgi:hypothetical protein